MNVLVIAPHPYYIDRGTPIDLDILLRALSARGETVEAVVYGHGEERKHVNVTLHRINDPWKWGDIGPGFSLKKVVFDVALFLRAWRLARRRDFDVVHAGEEAVFMAMFLKVTRRIPYIYDMDSSIAQQLVEKRPALRPLAGLFNWSEKKALQGCVAAAPVCNALADLARSRSAPHVVTLHDISQLEETDSTPTGELRRRLGIEGALALYVGNLEAYQGVDLLLESMPHAIEGAAEIQLVIAGGAEKNIRAYAKKARGLEIEQRVHFLGPWPVRDLGALLAEADILVAPRVKGVNTPMKIFPYLHSGRPVLVTDLLTHNQLLDDSLAVLAPPEPKAFGAALARLARDRELRQRLGAAGRRFVEANHLFAAHQSRVDDLYDWVGSQLPRSSAKLLRKGGAS